MKTNKDNNVDILVSLEYGVSIAFVIKKKSETWETDLEVQLHAKELAFTLMICEGPLGRGCDVQEVHTEGSVTGKGTHRNAVGAQVSFLGHSSFCTPICMRTEVGLVNKFKGS